MTSSGGKAKRSKPWQRFSKTPFQNLGLEPKLDWSINVSWLQGSRHWGNQEKMWLSWLLSKAKVPRTPGQVNRIISRLRLVARMLIAWLQRTLPGGTRRTCAQNARSAVTKKKLYREEVLSPWGIGYGDHTGFQHGSYFSKEVGDTGKREWQCRLLGTSSTHKAPQADGWRTTLDTVDLHFNRAFRFPWGSKEEIWHSVQDKTMEPRLGNWSWPKGAE